MRFRELLVETTVITADAMLPIHNVYSNLISHTDAKSRSKQTNQPMYSDSFHDG